jgi:hypothetical protein
MDNDAPRLDWQHALSGTNEQRIAALEQLVPVPPLRDVVNNLVDEAGRIRTAYHAGRRSVVDDLRAHHEAPKTDHVL